MKIVGSLIRAIIFTAATIYFGGYGVPEILSFTSDQICAAGEKAVIDPQVTTTFNLTEFKAFTRCETTSGTTRQADPHAAFRTVALTYGIGYFLVFLFFSQFSPAKATRSPHNPAQMAQVVTKINESDRSEIEALLKRGRTIDAVKKIREISSLDLTAAKNLADQFKTSDGTYSVTSVTTPIAVADIQSMMSSAISSDASVEDRLTKLQQLFDRKLITQAEYDSRRKEILEEI